MDSVRLRLSEVEADWLPTQDRENLQRKLERLAIDGQLEICGQHVWIINEFEEQVSDWQLIGPVGLSGGEWDWSADLIRYDPSERPDFGVNPRYFRNVSFNRTELFEWLERQPLNPAPQRAKTRGRPPEYDWEKIISVARAVAPKGFKSQNAFFTDLIGTLDEEGLSAPSLTALKTHDAVKQIAAAAAQNGRKMSD